MMAQSRVKSKNNEYTTEDVKSNTTEIKAEDLSKNEYASSKHGNVNTIFKTSISY